MYRLAINLKRLIMVAGDYAVFQIALVLTLLLRYGSINHDSWAVHTVPFSILSILWIISFYINGLYDLTLTRDNIKFFRAFLETMLINLGISFALFYLVPIFGIAPRTNLILDFAFTLLLGYAWRLLFNRTIAQTLFRNRVLFLGPTADAESILHLLQRSALGFELVSVIETTPGVHFDNHTVSWYTDLHSIDTVIREQNIQTVVLGHRPDELPGLKEALYKTLFTPVALLDRASLEETITGRVPLEYVTQTWFLEHLREGDKAWYEGAKRIVDIGLAIPFGVITLILYPFMAAAIKLSSPGPVLYSHMRIGKYGKPFRIWKFRSMHALSADGSAEEAGKPQFTSNAKTDPRLFPAGRILRQLRLDEFAQIWNVLRGDLSFVGPRPERPEFVDQLVTRMPYYALRHLTRPGLTGWAQTRFLTPTSTLEDNLKKLQYDLYYIKHRSFLLDLTIMLKTIGIMLKRQGT